MMRRILFISTLLFFAFSSFAKVKLPAIFSDNMVLQQQTSVAIWGWADKGEKITVTGSWSQNAVTATTTADGKWKLTLPTPKAGGPFTLRIAGTNTIELKDVLIGEVWVCSGQSNMVFSLKSSANAKEEIAKADLPLIRYFSVERQYGLNKFDDAPGSVWKQTSPATAGSYSAVAYYFAKKIQKELNVPVGIVYSAWGGTPAEAWTPGDVLNGDKILSAYFDRWKTIQDNVGKDSTAYHADLDKWKKDSTVGKKPEEPQTLYYYKRPWREPSVLFNGMIDPVIPYSIKGVLWYQGESNVAYADEYYQLLGSMIKGWRSRWNKSDMPFYFVQLASYDYNNLDAAARLREGQWLLTQKDPNTAMAVTLDVGDMKDIHYTHKKEVGDRLALIAMAKNYGKKEIVYKGPEFKKISTKDNQIVIEYAKPSIIKTASDSLKGFELGYKTAGSDSIIYRKASARITDNKVIVWNDGPDQPVAVRYGWLFPGEANLFNQFDLPAAPFQWKQDKH